MVIKGEKQFVWLLMRRGNAGEARWEPTRPHHSGSYIYFAPWRPSQEIVVPQKHLAIVLNHLASVSRGLANGSERETGQQRGQKEDPPPLPFSHR